MFLFQKLNQHNTVNILNRCRILHFHAKQGKPDFRFRCQPNEIFLIGDKLPIHDFQILIQLVRLVYEASLKKKVLNNKSIREYLRMKSGRYN